MKLSQTVDINVIGIGINYSAFNYLGLFLFKALIVVHFSNISASFLTIWYLHIMQKVSKLLYCFWGDFQGFMCNISCWKPWCWKRTKRKAACHISCSIQFIQYYSNLEQRSFSRECHVIECIWLEESLLSTFSGRKVANEIARLN